MEKKLVIEGAILVIICFLIGFGIGYFTGKISTYKIFLVKLAEKEKEINWYKTLLGAFYPPLPKEIHSFSGKITKIEGNSIWVEYQRKMSRFPLPEGKNIEIKEIKINTNNKTKIVGLEMPPLIPRELLKNASPEWAIKIISLQFEDLKVGNQVRVTSKENIKGKAEILANEIQLITFKGQK